MTENTHPITEPIAYISVAVPASKKRQSKILAIRRDGMGGKKATLASVATEAYLLGLDMLEQMTLDQEEVEAEGPASDIAQAS
jgi:hypothetical protein